MSNQVQVLIDDARQLQQFGDHDLALSMLLQAQQKDTLREHDVEIEKLFCLSYRKMSNYSMALLHINNAINFNAKRKNSNQKSNEHAVCLMNKGIVYEESKRYNDALNCYIPAVEAFISLYKDNPDEYGLIINALLTLGLFYYNQNYYEKAKTTLQSSLAYFGDGKEHDRRYIAICNTLDELQNK